MNMVSSKILIFCIVMFVIEIRPVVYKQNIDGYRGLTKDGENVIFYFVT